MNLKLKLKRYCYTWSYHDGTKLHDVGHFLLRRQLDKNTQRILSISGFSSKFAHKFWLYSNCRWGRYPSPLITDDPLVYGPQRQRTISSLVTSSKPSLAQGLLFLKPWTVPFCLNLFNSLFNDFLWLGGGTLMAYMQKTCDVAVMAILAKKICGKSA